MVKTVLVKNNFSSGELSPLLSTRTDVQQYNNGAKQLTNIIPLVEGGIRKRPGTYFRALVSDAVRLLPFVVNSETPYLLIFKPSQIIVYNPRTYEIINTLTSPYTAKQIPDIQFVQYRYSMFITHSDVAPYRFRCSKDFTNWEMAKFSFTHPPLSEDNARSPFRKATPSAKEVGAYVTVSLDSTAGWDEKQNYLAGDVVTYNKIYYQAILDSLAKTPSASNAYWAQVDSSTADVFSENDIGSYISINTGIIKITKFITTTQIGGEVVKGFDSTKAAIERAWTITPPAFNDSSGYPRCVTFFKQRLVLANTKTTPNKIWFSAVGGNANFLETTEDSDAFSVVSASGLSNSILFLEATRGVVCLTSGGEYMVSSSGGLTPTTVEINEHTSYGSYPMTKPCRVGNELLFVQRGGERLRALSYRYEVDGLVSPEISVLSSHIGEIHGGIEEITYQQEPESVVWCKLGDGKVASITFNRDQEVIAWAQQDFGGTVLSMCSVPTKLGNDQCFMLINRNGTLCLEEIGFDANMDSQRTLAVSNESVNIADATYLQTYQLLSANSGNYYSIDFEKNTNVLSLIDTDGEESKLQLGQPIRSTVVLFPPEIAQAPQTSIISKAKISRIAFFFRNTRGPVFNGKDLELFKFDKNNPFNAQQLFTGRHLYEGGHFSDLYDLPLEITLNKPLPFHMQALAIEITINER